MGLVDAIAAEDRVNIPVSEFRRLAHLEAKAFYLKNAMEFKVPEIYVKMIFGTADELEEYRKTGLTPEQIFEMDKLFTEKCVEVAELQEQLDAIKKGGEESDGRRVSEFGETYAERGYVGEGQAVSRGSGAEFGSR